MSTPTLPERIITPESGPSSFKHAFAGLIGERRQAIRLATRFFVRDTKADYRQSALGYVWLLIPPLGNTIIWVFLHQQNVVNIDSGSVPYPIFVLTGSVLWNAFNGAVMAMLNVMNSGRSLLARVNFPQESLIYAALMKTSLDAMIPIVLLIPTVFIFGIGLSPGMILFPAAFAGCLITGAAVGLITLPIGSLYSDVGRGIQFALRFGFFVTPVIYPIPAGGLGRHVMMLNPVSSLITSGRGWLLNSGEAMPVHFTVVVVLSVGVLLLGLAMFRLAMPHLVERLGG